MKVLYSAFLASLASFAPSRVTVAGQCIKGSFEVHFDGPCNTENIVAAFESQVFNQPMYDCPGTAAAEFTAQLNGKTVQDLCTDIVSDGVSLDEVVGVEGPEFLKNYYNGRTNWNDERQTETGEDTKVLKEQASQIKSYKDLSQKTDIAWPGHLSQFNLDECVSKTAYCCWVQDRQANDNNGNCASPYDTNCIDKDPGDNTDLCYVDLGRYDGHGTVGSGFFLFEHDNNKGEGAIHCHGQAWAADDSDYLSRYKGNNLFYISMYDHMYVRGYVREVPGAPMCGCSEKMPVVSRSDCTQTNVSEKFELHKKDGVLTVELKDLNLGFQACQAENNNDLESYVQKLVNEGKLTATHQAKFKESVVGNGQCSVAKAALLESKGLSTGFDNDDEMWLPIIGKGSLEVSNPINNPIQFKNQFAARPNQIVRRVCTSCIASHKDIYYRRLTPVPIDLDLLELLKSNWSVVNNNFGDPANNVAADFALYSTYADAIADTNRWQFCNFDGGVGFPRDCGPYGRVNSNWNSWKSTSGMAQDVAFYIEKETGGGAGGDGDVIPVLTNLALNKTCDQVNTAHGGVCERAIDNNFSGVWNDGSTTHTHWTKKPWWMVDLGDVHQIDSVVFANRQDCCTNRLKNIRVQIMNYIGGPVIKEVYMEGQLNRLNTADMEGVEGRYVKLVSDLGEDGNVLSLAEVAVYGKPLDNPPLELPNVAEGKTCYQIHTAHGGVCDRALDGDMNGNWGDGSVSHTHNSANPWMMVDLGKDYDISEITIANRRDCCGYMFYDATIEVMESLVGPVVSTTVFDGAQGAYTSLGFGTNSTVTGRVVKISSSHPEKKPLMLAEVIVRGSESAVQPDPLTNVVLAAPFVSQSTVYNNGVASLAADGNRNPNWNDGSVTHTHSEHVPFWSAYIGPTVINEVVLWNRMDCCSDRLHDAKVELYSDLAGTNLVASSTDVGYIGPVGGVTFDGVEAAFVKVSVDNGANKRPLMLAEVEVMGSQEEGVSYVNIARGKPAKQSSVGWGGVATRATDGNTAPNWNGNSMTHTLKELNPWWEVDLEKSYEINDVIIFNRYDCCWDRMKNVLIELYDITGGTPIANATIVEQVDRAGRGSVSFGGARGSVVRVTLLGTEPTVLNLAEVIILADESSIGAVSGTPAPTMKPTSAPSLAPSGAPTLSDAPSEEPSAGPSAVGTEAPTPAPSPAPTFGTKCQAEHCACKGVNCSCNADGDCSCASYDCSSCTTYACDA